MTKFLCDPREMDPAFSFSRLMATSFAIGGLIVMMVQPGPSVGGILCGLASILLCLVFSAVPKPRATRPAKPVGAFAVAGATTGSQPQSYQAPEPRRKPGAANTILPDLPTHRDRLRQKQARQKR